METRYHILNGDCLNEQFPKEIEGEIIICRECLVDGEVQSSDLEEFFGVRAGFIEKIHEESSAEDYFRDTVAEFEKVRSIPANSMVCLWFEDDLFCQVNLWFAVYLIKNYTNCKNVFLVRPKVHTPFGFGGLKQFELIRLFKDKILLARMDLIANLWEFYQKSDVENLRITAEKLREKLPFILEAVRAHIERIPGDDNPGRPTQSLLAIMKDLDTQEFGPIFKEFNKRESIYGFGDLQVKRLLDAIIKR